MPYVAGLPDLLHRWVPLAVSSIVSTKNRKTEKLTAAHSEVVSAHRSGSHKTSTEGPGKGPESSEGRAGEVCMGVARGSRKGCRNYQKLMMAGPGSAHRTRTGGPGKGPETRDARAGCARE